MASCSLASPNRSALKVSWPHKPIVEHSGKHRHEQGRVPVIWLKGQANEEGAPRKSTGAFFKKIGLTAAGVATGISIAHFSLSMSQLDLLELLSRGGGRGSGSSGGGGRGGWGWNGHGGKWGKHWANLGLAWAADESDEEDSDDEDEGKVEDKKRFDQLEKEKKIKNRGEKEPKKKEIPAELFDTHGMMAGTKLPVNRLNMGKRYKISDVELIDANDGLVPQTDSFHEMVTIQKNSVCTRRELEENIESMANSGMFQSVNAEAVANADGSIKLLLKFVEEEWKAPERVKLVNVGMLPPDTSSQEANPQSQQEMYQSRVQMSRECMLPSDVEMELNNIVQHGSMLTAKKLHQIRDRILKWYHSQGFVCANVVNFGNLNTDEIVVEVVEGDIVDLELQFLDRMNEPCEGETKHKLVIRELPKEIMPGNLFNIEAARKSLANMSSLQLFANMEVNPRPSEKNDGSVVIEVKVREQEPTLAELNTEWSVAPGPGGKPTLTTIQPGGTVTFEHRNLDGLARALLLSVSASNLWNPQEEPTYKLEYTHPYLDGIDDPRNRVGQVSCFNNRKLSAVFTGGPQGDPVPGVWVERAGIKATVTEKYTRQSKLTWGAVLEEVKTKDEQDELCAHGGRMSPYGMLIPDGPPTTLSNSGIDRIAFLQANLTRDNTIFINGTTIGSRDILEVDQGLGIGTKFPFFNRHQFTMTRFLQLSDEDKKNPHSPPWVAVLHGRYGGCVGDLPSYNTFTLGGPYSVRGFNMGELAACRRYLELAGELRIPVRNTHAYVFAELGSDLGSSKEVQGNPTEAYQRLGHGGSYGAGLKLGQIRAEYARDCNIGTGSWFVRFGERF